MGRLNGGRRRLPIEDAVSAGGVVWRRASDGVEVVLCGRNDGLRVLPKGTPDDGEALQQTALREVREETGLEVALGESLGTIEYWFTSGGIRYHKQVHHWLMEPTGGNIDAHDHEFEVVEWLPFDQAVATLTYENERRVLRRAAEKLGELAL
ncbi:MAG: NUDIX hydrolase [Tepidiformaceae bacterium]